MKTLACLAAVLFLLAGPAGAQFSLKWEQPPNCTDGFNVLSYRFLPEYLIVADDFQCNDPRPIARIRWWGSFVNWKPNEPVWEVPPENPFGLPDAFLISWHNYTHPEGEFSRPDGIISEESVPVFDVGWWCSHESWNVPGYYEHEYYFECFLPTPFGQEEGQYYFVNIVAEYSAPPLHHWGWKNSRFHWNDDAVQNRFGGDPATWEELTWPEGHILEGQSMDMAFELYIQITPTTTPSPSATPPPTATPTAAPTATASPVPPGLKWAQPPNCTDGFNIPSYQYPAIMPQVIADDFRCNDPRPIVRLRWWGSFQEWMDSESVWEELPPYPEGLPNAFLISWHTYTHPEGEFSRPDELISEESCSAYEAGWWCSHEVWNVTGHYEHEYYFECDLTAPFEQMEGQYYFVNIVAEYPSDPLYAWGWKNSEHHWNDDAVRDSGTGVWNELTWPEGHRLEGQSMDMAFELYVETTPTPTPTPPPTATPTPRATMTMTPPSATATPSPRATMTMTPPPATATPSPTCTVRGTPTVSPTPIPTATPSTVPRWIYDYNGDGTSDIAIFRPASGLWAIRGFSRVYFGSSSDTLVPGDYSGSGTTVPAIFRPSSGLWAIRSLTRIYFGNATDLPRPFDYNGDGRADIAIFRPASGLWAVRGFTRLYFGTSTDRPVPGYFAAGPAGAAVFRPSSGLWAIRSLTRIYFGTATDLCLPGDYSGSGNWSPAIFRPASGLWAIRGFTRLYFGASADTPIPGVYGGGSADLPAIFRPASGLWALRGLSRIYFGRTGDIPAAR